MLRALLAGDEAGVSDAVLALCRDRARAGCSQSAFRSDLERTWRAVGKRLPASYLALAATVWEQGPEHAA